MLKKLFDKLFPTYTEECIDNPNEKCVNYNFLKNGKIINTVKMYYFTKEKIEKFEGISNLNNN